MPDRLSNRILILLLLLLGAFVLTFADAAYLRENRAQDHVQSKMLAQRLGLTDLALFTEARYTRHPSQADLHAAFQDHPLALEHFPTGSILPPPDSLMHYLEAVPAHAAHASGAAMPGGKGKP